MIVPEYSVRVVKLGGSLLTLPDLSNRLQEWIGKQIPKTNIIIVGGGVLVDEVQRFCRLQKMGQEAEHWLCVRAMGINTQSLSWLLEDVSCVVDFEYLKHSLTGGGSWLFDVEQFLKRHEPSCTGVCLPVDEIVTSDSIAARVAVVLAAEELVLLKSTGLSTATTIEEAARRGVVDGFFPQLASELPETRCVNFRDESCSETRLYKTNELLF
ncbi:MAG: hypothetical protein CMJ81_02220 [Planctomycetaceae bacterium]|nr:hypothetical protein [Planctomycetaceae bacterium]MBP61757.1 hypothetical protein [Planctomycetaceae bacterium]